MQYGNLGALGGLPGLAAAAAASSGGQNGSASSAPSTSAASSSTANQQANAWYAMASQLAAQDYLTRLQSAARDPAAYAALAAQGVLPNYEMLTQGTKGGKGSKSKGRNSPAATNRASLATATSSPSMLDSLRLPSDTEIIKYTSSSTGPKVPGTTNRGRKKTISLDPSPASSTSPLTVPSASYAAAAAATGGLGALGALLGAAAAQGSASGVGSDSVDSSVGSSRDSTPSIPPGEIAAAFIN